MESAGKRAETGSETRPEESSEKSSEERSEKRAEMRPRASARKRPEDSAATTPKPRILVNGEPQEVPRSCTIERLIALLDLTGQRIAVARNREVVPRSTYAGVALTDGDRIEILEAVGGG